MTTQKQVRDVLQAFIQVHEKRLRVFSSLVMQAKAERFRVLSEALVHHQTRILDGLKNQLQTMSEELLRTWFKHPPDWPSSEEWDLKKIPFQEPEFERKFLPGLIMRCNQASMCFLESARSKAETPEVAELFASLMQMTERECLKQWQMTQAVEEL